MKNLIIALALTSLAASPALAKERAHSHPHLYMYSGAPTAQDPALGPEGSPPGVMVKGHLMTDPDPLIRLQLNRGYQAGTQD